jgi:hypothetical protein
MMMSSSSSSSNNSMMSNNSSSSSNSRGGALVLLKHAGGSGGGNFTMDSIAILDNAHPIMGVVASKLMGVVEKGRGRNFFPARKHPLNRILDTPLI